MKNTKLNKARTAKNDEFYTRYEDIENECQHYVKHFKDQWIYLPCDSEQSNFWKYFVDHFKEYGLKRLTATHINLDGTSSYRFDYDGSETLKTPLEGNGDFRSEECTKIKDECDIVITNPPFSLFKKFVQWLDGGEKKFLIIGNGNAVTYNEIFPLIKDNKIWLGVFYGSMEFRINADKFDESKCSKYRVEDGEYYINLNMITWLTNLEHGNRHKPLVLTKKYTPDEYPKYDNYDAINVNKVKDIPMDYDGVMGVPVTFLDKYCPEQFKIVGCPAANVVPEGWKGMSKEFVNLYYAQGGTGQYQEGKILEHYTKDGKAIIPYRRILIKYDRPYLDGKRMYFRLFIKPTENEQ